MKKIFTTVILSLGLFSYSNAQYNLFDPADVDADGWLWFDTQAKIDKYIGQANNAEGKFDPNGKLVQLVVADFEPYEDSEVSVDFVGAGTDGELGGADARKGGIRVAPSSASMTANGGGFVVKMPSCTSFNVAVSADSKMYARMLGTTDGSKMFMDYTIVSARFTTVFRPLASAGQFSWVDIQTLDNGNEPYFKLASSEPIYAYFQNVTKNNIYIHGLKVLTSTASSLESAEGDALGFDFDGSVISLATDANISVYNVQGVVVASASSSTLDVSNLTKGVYVVKTIDAAQNAYTRKIAIK